MRNGCLGTDWKPAPAPLSSSFLPPELVSLGPASCVRLSASELWYQVADWILLNPASAIPAVPLVSAERNPRDCPPWCWQHSASCLLVKGTQSWSHAAVGVFKTCTTPSPLSVSPSPSPALSLRDGTVFFISAAPSTWTARGDYPVLFYFKARE